MMQKQLVFENMQGQVLRAFAWSGEPVQMVRRADTGRLELRDSLDDLVAKKIPHQVLGEVGPDQLRSGKILIGELGHLSLVESIETTVVDPRDQKEGVRPLYLIMAGLALTVGMIGYTVSRTPLVTPQLEEELKQQVVKIARNITRTKPVVTATGPTTATTEVKPDRSTSSLKRMGALSALGSLKSGKQKGGLNLGQTQVSAGPGLGGTAGSGGTQTSIYSKGLVSAPLGRGGNVQGAGGVGTKGKGGGSAGYGSLSLVGASGSAPIPLGAEATVAKGLDKDQIAAVINRNMAQARFCYEQGLQSDPSLKGRVAVAFDIGPTGLVQAASLESSTLGSKIVEECLVMRLKSWKFPRPEGGAIVKVSYPFMFRRTGQG